MKSITQRYGGDGRRWNVKLLIHFRDVSSTRQSSFSLPWASCRRSEHGRKPGYVRNQVRQSSRILRIVGTALRICARLLGECAHDSIQHACLVALLVLTAVTAPAQACPKVTYINPAATVQSLVFSVNCLIDTTERARSRRAEAGTTEFMVEAVPITGPRHTRAYGTVVFAVLAVPADNTTKTALVTPEDPSASVSGTAGAECKIKINADNTADGQCKQTGGMLYVIYHD